MNEKLKEINALLPDNTQGEISEADMRECFKKTFEVLTSINKTKADTSELENKANLTDLETKANTDGSNIDALKYYEKIKVHIPASGGASGGASDITKAEVTKMLKDLTIGGQNLVRNTALPVFTANSEGRGRVTQMSDSTGYFVRYIPDNDKSVSVYGFFLAESHEGKHSMSMDFRHSHTSAVQIWGQNVPPNIWTRLKKEAFTNPNGWSGFNSDTNGVAIDVRRYKIEQGSKATDWTPHIDEYVLGTAPTKIDQVFQWQNLDISVETNGANNRVIYGVPYIDAISTVLECYLIYTDGTSAKIDVQFGQMSSGKMGIAFNSNATGGKSTNKLYLKALLK